MNILEAADGILMDLKTCLKDIDVDQYKKPLDILSNSSIGQHNRHVIEFFQCLNNQSHMGIVNYDKRDRNTLLLRSDESPGINA